MTSATETAPPTLFDITRALEPTRQALHAAANTYPRHSDDYRRWMGLAVDLTVAEERLRDAVKAAEQALILAPTGRG